MPIMFQSFRDNFVNVAPQLASNAATDRSKFGDNEVKDERVLSCNYFPADSVPKWLEPNNPTCF